MPELRTLRAAREVAGMSQAEVGALIGKTASHYGKIEAGAIGFKAREALVLCRAFNLTLEELLS